MQQLSGHPQARLGGVGMRIGLIGRGKVQLVQQVGYGVGMQVEPRDDGHVGSDDGAQPGQQIGFRAVQADGLHASVQA
ncbi:hypothetical protein D3C87_1650370 [compost metagenome]